MNNYTHSAVIERSTKQRESFFEHITRRYLFSLVKSIKSCDDMMLVVMVVVLSCIFQGRAQVSSVPRDIMWSTYPTDASTLAFSDDVVYVGGQFTNVFRPINPEKVGAPIWNAASGYESSAAYPLQGVSSYVPDSAGGWFVGGYYSTPAGPSNLVHLIHGRTLDPTWRPDPDGAVGVGVTEGNLLYVAGDFTRIGGLTRKSLAALRVADGIATEWAPEIQSITALNEHLAISTMAASAERVFVAGVSWGGFGETYAARFILAGFDAKTGRRVPWASSIEVTNHTPNWDVWYLYPKLVLTGRTVYLAGNFTHINGERRDGIAALDAETGKLLSWSPRVLWRTQRFLWSRRPQLILHCGTLYFAGDFYDVDGQSRNAVAAFDPETGGLTNWKMGFGPPLAQLEAVEAIGLAGHSKWLFVAGNELVPVDRGQGRRFLSAFDTETGSMTDWSLGGNGLLLDDGERFESGVEGSLRIDVSGGLSISSGKLIGPKRLIRHSTPPADRVTRNGAFAIDMRTEELTSWAPEVSANSSFPGTVLALALSGERVYLGGVFDFVGGQPRRSIAAVDRSTGHVLPWQVHWPDGLNLDNVSQPLSASDGFVIVSGVYKETDNRVTTYKPFLCALNEANAEIRWLHKGIYAKQTAGSDGRLLVLTYPTIRDGNTMWTNGLIALDIRSGQPLNWQPRIQIVDGPIGASKPGTVHDFAIVHGLVYLAGEFTHIDGQRRAGFGAVDFATGAVSAWAPDAQSHWSGDTDIPPPSGYQIVVRRGVAYATGGFSHIGNEQRLLFAALDQLTARPLDWPVDAVLFQSRAICFVCDFRIRNSTGASHVVFDSNIGYGFPVVFPPRGAPAISTEPYSQTVGEGHTASFSVEHSGEHPQTIQWSHDGRPVAGATNATLTLARASLADAGNYSVLVSNRFGTDASRLANLKIVGLPVIRSQPESILVRSQELPQVVTFGVEVSANSTVYYQWRRNGIDIPGENTFLLRIASVSVADSGDYSVVVRNVAGAVSSKIAKLVIEGEPLTLSDDLENSILISGEMAFSGVGVLTNGSATRQAGEPSHAGSPAAKSVWTRWQAPSAGRLRFHTLGSDFDTVIAIYQGNSTANLVRVAQDDDGARFLNSEVNVDVDAGVTYAVVVDGFGGSSGRIVLGWSFAPELGSTSPSRLPIILAQPADRLARPGESVAFAVNASGLLPITYQWYRDCVAIPSATNALLVLTNATRALVGAYSVRVGAAGTVIESRAAILELDTDAKTMTRDKLAELYLDSDVAQGPTPATARTKGFVSVAAGVVGTHLLSNFQSTLEPGEPLHAGVLGGASRWFRLRAAGTGFLAVDSSGSDVDTLLAVYKGTSLADLVLVADDDNGAPDGISALVVIPVERDAEYLVAVDSVGGVPGTIKLSWTLGQPPSVQFRPLNQTLELGESVSLEAVAEGFPTPTIQWTLNDAPLRGATNADVQIREIQSHQAGSYGISVRNALGQVNKTVAVISVARPMQLRLLQANPSGQIPFVLDGARIGRYSLEASSDFKNWEPVDAADETQGQVEFKHYNPEASRYRFYRAVGQ